MSESNGTNKKRYYAIMIGLVVVGGMVYYFNSYIKSTFTNDAAISIQETQQQVQKVSNQVALNTMELVNVTQNQQANFKNQKVLATGINDLGAVVGGDVKDIKDKTSLLDDIKFNTEQILNKTTLGNITLPGTRLIDVNISNTAITSAEENKTLP